MVLGAVNCWANQSISHYLIICNEKQQILASQICINVLIKCYSKQSCIHYHLNCIMPGHKGHFPCCRATDMIMSSSWALLTFWLHMCTYVNKKETQSLERKQNKQTMKRKEETRVYIWSKNHRKPIHGMYFANYTYQGLLSNSNSNSPEKYLDTVWVLIGWSKPSLSQKKNLKLDILW